MPTQNEIMATLQNSIDHQRVPPVLKLNQNAFPGPVEQAVLTLLNNAISISGIVLSPIANGVEAKGTWTPGMPPFSQMTVTADFLAGDQVSLKITAGLTTDWRFSQGFPFLSGQPWDAFRIKSADFMLAANASTLDLGASLEAQINGFAMGDGFFEVRHKDGGGSGSLAGLVGFVLPAHWSPASVWSGTPLAAIFSQLSFADSGLIVSNLPATDTHIGQLGNLPSLPASIKPGLTFFTSMDFGTGILKILGQVFTSAAKLNLMAYLDLANMSQSTLSAELAATGVSHASLSFHSIDLKYAFQSETLTLDMVLDLNFAKATAGTPPRLVGGVDVALSAEPAFDFFLELDQWHNPFGMQGITIDDVKLDFKVDEAGVTMQLSGIFEVGQGQDTFQIILGVGIVDFEAPDALIFAFKAEGQAELTLVSLIKVFSSIDLNRVPVLNAIAFKQLSFYVVADPAGFTTGDGHTYRGIGFSADIMFHSLEAKIFANAAISPSGGISGKGITASGSINEAINLLDGMLVISELTDTSKGPCFSIDTAAFFQSSSGYYLTLDVKVSLLKIASTGVAIKAARNSLDFELDASLPVLGTITLKASMTDWKSFSASVSADPSVNFTTPAWKIGSTTIIPSIHIDVGAHLSMSFAIDADKHDASISFSLGFTWAGQTWSISFSLDLDAILNQLAGDLTKIWNVALDWLGEHIKDFFVGAFDDLKKAAEWLANAVKQGFIAFVNGLNDLVKSLKEGFNMAVQEVAKLLAKLGYEFEKIAHAIADAFNIAFQDAVNFVKEAFDELKQCAMSLAGNQLASGPGAAFAQPAFTSAQVLADLTASTTGNRLLVEYYRMEPYLHLLVASDHFVRQAINQALSQPDKPIEGALRVLETLRAQGDMDVQAAAARAIEALEPHRHQDYTTFLGALK